MVNLKVKNTEKEKKPLASGKKKEEKAVPDKKEINKNKKTLSQLRQDLVTGDWVVISTIRSKRPDEFARQDQVVVTSKEEDCLFCDPEKSKQGKDTLIYNTDAGDWSLRVFPNKFPAFSQPKGKIAHQTEGPFFWMEGVGYHEVFVTRDHQQSIGQMEIWQVAELVDAFQTRYLDLMNKKSVRYVDIFHNHGPSAGGHIFHPHSQLMAIPVVSPYVQSELDGAERYWRENKKCVYCSMAEWELEEKKRVIFENDQMLVFCPFASRANFEMWIVPKKHQPYFERIDDGEKFSVGEALHEALRKLNKALDNPDYNFYVHTSPCDGKDYPHYHWHIEILPKLNIWAGFELSTGVEISTIEPEVTAEYLRKI